MTLTPDNPTGYGYITASGQFMTEVLFGEGIVPIAEAIAVLKEHGYDGSYALEYNPHEDGWAETEACIAYMEGVLSR